jgi:hypothetical protein
MATKAPVAEENRTLLQKLFTYIPNDYLEKPKLVKDEEFAIHEPKVGKKFATLEVIGKFCTVMKYFSILTCITILISLTLFRGSDISYSVTDPTKLTFNFTLTLLQDPEVQNLKCPTSKNDLVLGDFTTFTFNLSDVCRLVSEDLVKGGFQRYADVANYTNDGFNSAAASETSGFGYNDYMDDVNDLLYSDYGNSDSDYGNSDYSYDYYTSDCSNHESCRTDQYCDQFNSCYECDMYAFYGGVVDTFDKSTPWCNDISPPSSPPPPSPLPPSPPPSLLNGACSNHDDCTTATHYCDSAFNCYTCDSYYYWGGAADSYDGSTAACFSISVPPPPPPPPTSDDCWWCFWSTSSNLGESGGDDSESASTSVAKKKKSTSALPSPPPSISGTKSTTEKNKFERTGRKRTPMKETNCGADGKTECKYINLKSKLKQSLGNYSFCRSDDNGRTTPICTMVQKNCEYSRKIQKEAELRLERSLLPFSSLADKNLLQLTVNAHKDNIVEAMVSGLKSPESIIKQWSSANLPRLTGFINVLFTTVRGLRFRQHKSTEIDTNFTLHVTKECKEIASCEPTSQIGDGICQEVCNVPECLYDGGDCLSLDLGKDPTYIVNTDKSDFTKYKQRGFTQIAWQAPGLANTRNFSLIVNQTMDSLPNEFEYFDKEHVCGDPDSWYEYHEVKIEDAQNPRRIIDELIKHQAMDNLLEANPNIKIPPEPSIPFPQKMNMTYSCDNFPNILAPSPYAETLSVSDMEKWLDWADDIMAFLRDRVLSEEESSSHYSDELGEKIEEFESKLYYPLKYARVVKLATENSGSFYALNLDASLNKLPNEKMEDREYDVTATVNYKKYFENSGLLSCTYTKKFKIEPSAVVAVVVGIIGGVTSGCAFLAQLLYLVLKVFAVGSARQ